MSALVAGGVLAFGANNIHAATRIDNDHVQVESGDTLSQIAQENNMDVDQLAQINHIQNKDLIHVGDKLVVTPSATTENNNNQATTVKTSATTNSNTGNAQSGNSNTNATSSNGSGNSMAALRRSIESGGNYNTNTGNGYIGAYQFAPSTIAGIESATGMKWSMDPATQDAFANYYANSRYGGWQDTPKTGGW